MSALLQTLGAVCPVCDLYLPPGAARCSECGTPLSAGQAASPPPPAVPQRESTRPTPPAPIPAVAPVPPLGVTPPGATPVARLPLRTRTLETPAALPRAPEPLPEPPAPRTRTPTELNAVPGAASIPPPPRRTDAPPGMRPAARAVPPSSPPRAPPVAPVRPAITATPAEPVRPTDLQTPTTRAPSPAATTPAAKPSPTPSKYGLRVLAGSGAGQRYRLGGAGCMIGRARGAILFPDDPHLAPHHATLLLRDGRLFVRDESTLSGVFISVGASPELLPAGGYVIAGSRLFRYRGPLPPAPATPPGKPLVYGAPVSAAQTLYTVEEILVGNRPGRTAVSAGPLLTIGQTGCDLSYPADTSLAPRHCELTLGTQAAQVRDLSGGLGTFVRIPAATERLLNPGDRLRLGGQLVQIEAAG